MRRSTRPPQDRQRCRECPLFEPLYDHEGADINAAVFASNGERVVKDGIPQLWKHKDGGLVRWGMCGAKLPDRHMAKAPTGQEVPGTSMREVRSDWFCESQEKYDAIRRRLARDS